MSGLLTIPVNDRDHVAGSRSAPVRLVEYGDFECPHCRAAYPVVESARRYLGDRLCVVYRHFPLTEIHPHAELAAEASESADVEGMFWPMHHTLFDHQNALELRDLERYARSLQVDVERFMLELATGVHTDRVREDFRSGVRSGVNGTPTFFINGVRYDGAWDDIVSFVGVLAHAATEQESGAHDGRAR